MKRRSRRKIKRYPRRRIKIKRDQQRRIATERCHGNKWNTKERYHTERWQPAATRDDAAASY